MVVLVTGGAGYVGTVVLPRLLDSGYSVRCLDLRLPPAQLCSALEGSFPGSFEAVQADIRDRDAVRAAFKGVDACVHLAAMVGYPACDADPDAARTTNVDGSNVLAQHIEPGLPFVMLSTCSVYGRVSSGVCREDDPVQPLSLYGKTKLIAEGIVGGRGGVSLRATTAYGPSPRFRWDLVVHDFIRMGFTGTTLRLYEPHALRPFIHVEDIAAALCFALPRAPALAGCVFNLGSDCATVTKLDLARRVAALTGLVFETDPDSHDADGRNYRVGFDRIEEHGFPPRHPFQDGLVQTVDWARSRLS